MPNAAAMTIGVLLLCFTAMAVNAHAAASGKTLSPSFHVIAIEIAAAERVTACPRMDMLDCRRRWRCAAVLAPDPGAPPRGSACEPVSSTRRLARSPRARVDSAQLARARTLLSRAVQVQLDEDAERA